VSGVSIYKSFLGIEIREIGKWRRKLGTIRNPGHQKLNGEGVGQVFRKKGKRSIKVTILNNE